MLSRRGDGWQFISFFLCWWLKLMALSTPSCQWLMGLFTTSPFGLEGDTEWGFCQHSGRFGWVPEPRVLQPKLCLPLRSPWALGDFNHFPNRCIAVRMDKVLKLALCSVEPKFCSVTKVSIFCFQQRNYVENIVSSNFIPVSTVTFLTIIERLLNSKLRLWITPLWLNKRVKWKLICEIPLNSLCKLTQNSMQFATLRKRIMCVCVCVHEELCFTRTGDMCLLFIIWQGPQCVT